MVKAGYKHTEIGEIPDNWEVGSIQDFLNRGIIIDQMDGNHGELYPRSHEFTSFGVPYITANDFATGKLSFRNCKYLKKEKALKFKKGISKNGDVLFAHNATVGPTAILDCDDAFVIISTTATYYRCDSDRLSNLYLKSAFESCYFKSQYSMVMSQSTRNQVPITAQRKLIIAVPPLPEQTKIADALSDIEGLIVSLEKLIEKKRDIKTATMQQLLTGKKRLPGFGDGKGTKQSELGEIPEDWDVRKYGDTFAFLSTANNSRADLYEDGDVEYIHYGDIHTKLHFNLDLERQTLPKIDRNKLRNPAFIADGDIVMADASEDYEGIGKSIEISNVGTRRVVSGLHTFLLRDTERRYANGFRGYLHSIPAIKRAFDTLATGLKVYGLSKNSLKSVSIPVPPFDEQVEIVKVISCMDDELHLLEEKLSKAKAIKQGMMQELLTGRTRLV